MKSDIDLTSPNIQFIVKRVQEEATLALDVAQTVESAVIPIYAILQRKSHLKPKTKLEQIGSGILIKIKDTYFVFSATHVFFEFNNTALYTGFGKGTEIIGLPGDRFSTGRLDAPNSNSLDATVFHIQTEIPKYLQDVAITMSDLDLSEEIDTDSVYIIAGFRIKKSNTSGNIIKTLREAFPSCELSKDYYSKFGKDENIQFLFSYDNQILIDKQWKTSPIPKGFSGGAIIKAYGTSIRKLIGKSIEIKQLLSAIIIEHHRGKNKLPGYVLGTRLNVYFGLIDKFLPGFLDDV